MKSTKNKATIDPGAETVPGVANALEDGVTYYRFPDGRLIAAGGRSVVVPDDAVKITATEAAELIEAHETDSSARLAALRAEYAEADAARAGQRAAALEALSAGDLKEGAKALAEFFGPAGGTS